MAGYSRNSTAEASDAELLDLAIRGAEFEPDETVSAATWERIRGDVWAEWDRRLADGGGYVSPPLAARVHDGVHGDVLRGKHQPYDSQRPIIAANLAKAQIEAQQAPYVSRVYLRRLALIQDFIESGDWATYDAAFHCG